MTVTSTTSRVQYQCNVNVLDFSVPFPFLDARHLVVTLIDDSVPPVVRTFVLGTDYAVSGAGNPAGGNVRLNQGWVNSYTLAITRVVPKTQEVSFAQSGPFSPAIHEAAFDKLTMLAQQGTDTLEAHLEQQIAQAALQAQTTSVGIQVDVDVKHAAALAATAALRAEIAAGMSGEIIDLKTVQAPGTTTPRTLAARVSDRVNVKDYGAVGDGVTLCDAAFAAALADAYSSGKGFYVPGGVYAHSKPLFPQAPISIEGDGSTVSFLRPTFDGPAIMGAWGDQSFLNTTGIFAGASDSILLNSSVDGYLNLRDSARLEAINGRANLCVEFKGRLLIWENPLDPLDVHNRSILSCCGRRSKHEAISETLYVGLRQADQRIEARLRIGGTVRSLVSTTQWLVNATHHVVLDFSGAVLRLFVDGTEEASWTHAGGDNSITMNMEETFSVGPRIVQWPETNIGIGTEEHAADMLFDGLWIGPSRRTANFTPPTTRPAATDSFLCLNAVAEHAGLLLVASSGQGSELCYLLRRSAPRNNGGDPNNPRSMGLRNLGISSPVGLGTGGILISDCGRGNVIADMQVYGARFGVRAVGTSQQLVIERVEVFGAGPYMGLDATGVGFILAEGSEGSSLRDCHSYALPIGVSVGDDVTLENVRAYKCSRLPFHANGKRGAARTTSVTMINCRSSSEDLLAAPDSLLWASNLASLNVIGGELVAVRPELAIWGGPIVTVDDLGGATFVGTRLEPFDHDRHIFRVLGGFPADEVRLVGCELNPNKVYTDDDLADVLGHVSVDHPRRTHGRYLGTSWPSAGTIRRGDWITPASPAAASSFATICTQAGTLHAPYAEGRTATANNTDLVTLSGTTETTLRPGDWISIGGVPAQIADIYSPLTDPRQAIVQLLLTGAINANGAGLAIEYLAPALSDAGDIYIPAVRLNATPGNGTAHTVRGDGAFAIGASSVVIANNLVHANSRVFAMLQTQDATLTQIVRVEVGAQTMTIVGNAAATAAVRFCWWLDYD